MVQFNFDVIKSNGHTVNISWTYSNNLYYDTMHLYSYNYFDVFIGHKTVLATIFHLKVSAWNTLIAPHLPVPNLLTILEVPTSTILATASWIHNPRRSANGTFPKSPPVPVESPAGYLTHKVRTTFVTWSYHSDNMGWEPPFSGVWPSIPEFDWIMEFSTWTPWRTRPDAQDTYWEPVHWCQTMPRNWWRLVVHRRGVVSGRDGNQQGGARAVSCIGQTPATSSWFIG